MMEAGMGAMALYLAMEISALDCQPSDLYRFPRSDAVAEAKRVFDARLSYLLYQQAWHPREHYFWQERIDELRLWHRCWVALGDAIDCNESRVEHLQVLRRRIGESNYAAGQMPGPP